MNHTALPPMIPIPPVDADGYLPLGLHAATLAEVRDRFASANPELFETLAALHRTARDAGVDRLILAGRFISQQRTQDLDGILFGSMAADWEPVLQFISDSSKKVDFFVATNAPMLRALEERFTRRRDGGRRGLIEIPIAGAVATPGILVNPATHEAVLAYQIQKLRQLEEEAGDGIARQAYSVQIKALEKEMQSTSPRAFYQECLRTEQEMAGTAGRGDIQINSVVGLLLEEQKPFRVVDFGCGKGRLAYELATLDHKVLKRMDYIGVSVDVTEANKTVEALALRSLCNQVELHTLDDTASLRNTADYLISINVLHEIPLKELGRALYNAISTLRNSALFVLHDMEHLVHGERNFVPWSGEDARQLFDHRGANVTVRRHKSKSGIPLFTLTANFHGAIPSAQEITRRALSIYARKEADFIQKRAEIVGVAGEEREYAYLSVAIANIREQLAGVPSAIT